MGQHKSLARRVKLFEESFSRKVIEVHYRRTYGFVLNSAVKDVPEEVTKAAVRKVWDPYKSVNAKWAQYYWSKNGIASPYYIPTDLWFSRICRKMNELQLFRWPQLQDKNYLDVVFPDVRRPEVLVRNISGQYLDREYRGISEEEAVSLCLSESEVIIKPSISSKGGKGIEFIRTDEGGDPTEKIRENLRKRQGDFAVQKVLHQHPVMAGLNPDSINTLRVLTMLWNGEVIILGSLVRIGRSGCRIDNPHTSDGVSCVLTAEGKMIDTAYDRNWNAHDVLPNGQKPGGFAVPEYERILETVKRLHFRISHSRLVGWDMTVSEDGEPILIEANLDYPEVYFHQIGSGPVITDPELFSDVMTFVFK